MLNEKYLTKALEKVGDPRKLVVLASRRARQLSHGGRPMVKANEVNHINTALLEIAEGLVTLEKRKKQN